MKTNQLLKKQLLLLAILFITCLSLNSCSNESPDLSKSVTNNELNDFNLLAKGGPVSQFLNITCEADVISVVDGCNSFQIRFYMTDSSGERRLFHSANMSTGDCVEKNDIDPCNGDYHGDFIIKDDKLNGCIKDFIDSDINIYNMYISVRDQITR